MVARARERRYYRFHGRVQGVMFRATTREFALTHEVTGWVRNLPDGTVEAEMQGAPERIESVLDDLASYFIHNITSRNEEPRSLERDEFGFTIRC